jgi:phage baseplate assembly protein W
MASGDYVYDSNLDIWPDLKYGRVILSPVRIGVDRHTGKIITGWDHVVLSLLLIFSTRYHERVLRRWAGSFVPHLIGENATVPTIARFYWAMATGIDLWEPGYRMQRARVGSRANGSNMTSPEELRAGRLTTGLEGVYRPRGHLGDSSAQVKRSIGLVSNGYNLWESRAGMVGGAPEYGIGTTPGSVP